MPAFRRPPSSRFRQLLRERTVLGGEEAYRIVAELPRVVAAPLQIGDPGELPVRSGARPAQRERFLEELARAVGVAEGEVALGGPFGDERRTRTLPPRALERLLQLRRRGYPF